MSRNQTVSYVAALAALAVVASGCCCAQWVRHWHDAEVSPEVAHKWFWSRDCKPLEPEPQEAPQPAPATECGLYISEQTYPGPHVLRVEKNMPDEVQIDSDFDYTITVTNVSDHAVENVTVREEVGANFEYSSSEPSAESEDDRLVWSLGSLDAGQSRSIRVSGRATDMECIRQCATVSYDVPTCGFTRVINPQLSISVAAPDRVSLCEDIPLTYTVSNEGTGTASEVVIVADLPEGLETVDGQRQVEIPVGSVDPGATQEHTVMARARETGEFETRARSRGAGDLQAESEVITTTVIQPVFEINYRGTSQQYVQRPVELTLTVENVGSGPAMNTVVEADVPAGAADVSASGDGRVMGDRVVWDLGTLDVDESRELSISYTAETADTYTSTARASAICAETQEVRADTTVSGLAAILLEVVDTADPVEVGEEETYIVTVTNQGTAADSNIRIRCELEDSMEYVSSSGPTEIEERDGVVTFEPLDELGPGDTATWRIVVRGVRPADARFRVVMNSDQLGREVAETEATQFYSTQ